MRREETELPPKSGLHVVRRQTRTHRGRAGCGGGGNRAQGAACARGIRGFGPVGSASLEVGVSPVSVRLDRITSPVRTSPRGLRSAPLAPTHPPGSPLFYPRPVATWFAGEFQVSIGAFCRGEIQRVPIDGDLATCQCREPPEVDDGGMKPAVLRLSYDVPARPMSSRGACERSCRGWWEISWPSSTIAGSGREKDLAGAGRGRGAVDGGALRPRLRRRRRRSGSCGSAYG